MVKGDKKYICREYFQQNITQKESEHGKDSLVFYELTISETALTDEEEAKLKDILREAAEKANAFLGW